MAKGGKREGAGRKGKIEEVRLLEQLDKYIDPEIFSKELADLIKNSKDKLKLDALKLYAEYRFGKPQQAIDLTTAGNEFPGIKPIEWVV